MKRIKNKFKSVDFFIITIASLLVLLNFHAPKISGENFLDKAQAGSSDWRASYSPNHLVPANNITFPYRPKGVPLFNPQEITAKEAAVVDQGTGRILFQKDAHAKRPIASLTKLMTALVWTEIDGNLDKVVTFESGDYRDGSVPYFIAGEEVKTKDLLYAGLIASSNSAMAALVRSSGQTQEDFVKLMNIKAKELGMTETNFVEPTGLDSRNMSTASDLFILARNAFEKLEISRATQLQAYTFKPINKTMSRSVKNTNWLLGGAIDEGNYKIQGGKTGYIEESDYNFVLKIYNKEKDKDLIVILLGSKETDSRFLEAKKLVEWAYKSYLWKI